MVDKRSETFVLYVTALKASPESAKMTIYLSQVAQVLGDNVVYIGAI